MCGVCLPRSYRKVRPNRAFGDDCLRVYLERLGELPAPGAQVPGDASVPQQPQEDTSSMFRDDAVLPPRGLVHRFVQHHGVKGIHARLWAVGEPMKIYREDLALFKKWYRVPVSVAPPRGRVRLYRRFHRRVKLCRADKTTPQSERMLLDRLRVGISETFSW